jgi:TldD protein
VSLRQFVLDCLDAAVLAGASYADVRVVDTATQRLSVRTGRVDAIESGTSFGFGVRVVADGAWGFASSSEVTDAAAVRIAREAVAIARASAIAPGTPVDLAPVDAFESSWRGPYVTDPFQVGVEEKLSVLLAADEALRREPAVNVTQARMGFVKVTKTFGSTVGSYIEQHWI